MKSLKNFKAKKISKSIGIIGGGFVHTGGFIMFGLEVTHDVFYDSNGDGICSGEEWESYNFATAKK